MDLGLHNKVAVVTGASRGLGLAIAESLAREGCKLAICARGKDGLEAAAEGLGKLGVEVLSLPLDITDSDAHERLIGAAVDRFGRLDILVNSAGGNRRGRFTELDDGAWDEILDLNFKAHVRMTRSAVPHLSRASGAVLFITSIFGREAGGPGLTAYNSTKSALISLAKIMALELAEHGVRVNSLAPGSIRFPGGSWDRRCIEDPDAMAEFVDRNLPFGRFGRAQEIGDVAAFLVSKRASWITGACLNVDGGQSRALF